MRRPPPTRSRVAVGTPALLAALVVTALAGGSGLLPRPARAAEGTGWAWPLSPVPAVLASFRAPAGPFAAGHRGVDLAAVVGAVVRAAGAGRVAFAGPVAGRPVVSVDHPGGLRTTYEPVTPLVSQGEPVARGDPVGTVSAAPGHCLPSTCLHWGLRRGELYLDPLHLVGEVEVRLLPVWAGLPWAGVRAAGEPSPRRPEPTDRGPLLVADRLLARWPVPRRAPRRPLRAGPAGPPRGAGSRRGRCRRGPRAGGSRSPPRR